MWFSNCAFSLSCNIVGMSTKRNFYCFRPSKTDRRGVKMTTGWAVAYSSWAVCHNGSNGHTIMERLTMTQHKHEHGRLFRLHLPSLTTFYCVSFSSVQRGRTHAQRTTEEIHTTVWILRVSTSNITGLKKNVQNQKNFSPCWISSVRGPPWLHCNFFSQLNQRRRQTEDLFLTWLLLLSKEKSNNLNPNLTQKLWSQNYEKAE